MAAVPSPIGYMEATERQNYPYYIKLRYTPPKGTLRILIAALSNGCPMIALSYGPPWAHSLGGYQDRLLGGPLGLLILCHTAPDGGAQGLR
jgi:hypothetical protein